MAVLSKRCSSCQVIKPATEFGASNDRKSGLRSRCKPCAAKRRKQRDKQRQAILKKMALDALGDTLTCKSCGEEKPIIKFARSPNSHIGFSRKCLVCVSNDAKRPDAKTRRKDYQRMVVVERQYGLPYGQYQQMLKQQGNVCAICKKPETRRIKGKVVSLCVDHDHKTGAVRGLICRKCNGAIGMLGDDEILVREALRYLMKYRRKLSSGESGKGDIQENEPSLFGDVA